MKVPYCRSSVLSIKFPLLPMPAVTFHPPFSEQLPVRCEVPSDLDTMDDIAFFEWCQAHRELKIERTSSGEIVIMSPTGWETGGRNSEINFQLHRWATENGRGIASDSSTGYILPNRAERSPDASWTSKVRLRSIAPEDRRRFLPLCPDFVIELCSPSDTAASLHPKMVEYLTNGASLGWLIDPDKRTVTVYRPGQASEPLKEPTKVRGEGALEGFVLELGPVFDLGI